MVTSVALYLVLLVLVVIERLNELRVSRHNARVAFAAGGVERGQGHYRFMTVMHTLFLFACVGEVVLLHRAFPGWLGWVSLAVVVGAQALRAWAIASLGERWNTRVIVRPDAAPVTTGPYRFLKHPNYVAVIAEILFLPLVHGAWVTAVVFTIVNAGLLFVRIRVEEQALGADWARTFADRGRFLPGGTHG
jgi:methyltransferase